MLEQYEFPFERVFPKALDAGNLNAKYDVLIFVDNGACSALRVLPRRHESTRKNRLRALSQNELGRRDEAVQVPADEFLNDEGGVLGEHSLRVEIVLPQIHCAAEVL